MKLDAKTITTLTLPHGKDDHVFWDDDLPGFGYRLHRSSKTRIRGAWIIQYRNQGGRSRRMTIGHAALPAIEARKLAAQTLAKVRIGGDPRADKVAARERGSKTFRALAEEFIAFKKEVDSRRPSTLRIYRYALLNYSKALHHIEAGAVTRADIAAVLTRVQREYGAHCTHETRGRLNSLYIWAIGEGLVESNPVVGVRRIEYSANRERVLSNDELVKVWNACDTKFFPFCANFGRIMRLLILTGARRSEIVGLPWSEINFDTGVWTLAAERSKNGREHKLRLPRLALTILSEVKQLAELTGRPRDCVFSQEGKMNVQRHLGRLKARSGVQGWIIHDVRKTVATGMARIGILPHIIECVLNHRSGFRSGVHGIYNLEKYEPEVTQALLRWAEHVMALVEGRPDKVVALRP